MPPLNARFLDFLSQRPLEDPPLLRHAGRIGGIAALFAAAAVGTSLATERAWGLPIAAIALAFLARAVRSLIGAVRARKARRQALCTAAHGAAVTACVLRAHPGLFRPGSVSRPCRVVFSFDPAVGADPEYLEHVGQRWEARRPETRFQVGRRLRLPDSLTDGYPIFAEDMLLPPVFLKRGSLAADPLTCIARPGDAGGIELVPHWLHRPGCLPALPGEGQRV